MEAVEFRSVMSKGILALYIGLLIIIAAIYFFILINVGSAGATERVFIFSVMLFVFAIIFFIIARALKMRFVVTDADVAIHGIFKTHVIGKGEIEAIEKTPIPFGFRLFGASFLGGFYYLPGIGFAWVSMGNFRDGVIITTKEKKNFVITPEDPDRFINLVKRGLQ